jgi:hypothetical protein
VPSFGPSLSPASEKNLKASLWLTSSFLSLLLFPLPSPLLLLQTLVYTLLGFALTFANALSLPAMPLDTDRSQFYVSTEAASILPKLTSQKLRKMPGGLEKIEEGLRIMEAGSYRAEKLVYSLKKE